MREEKQMEFANWLNDFCPPDPGLGSKHHLGEHLLSNEIDQNRPGSKVECGWCDPRLDYATSFSGPTHLRPYMLSWRADSGCSGFIEPEVGAFIMELLVSEGCLA